MDFINPFEEYKSIFHTKDRDKVIDEAVARFDLSPLDCEFFYKHFSGK